ncbi:MAG: zinc-ribbon and DUF3426 domain-containing protein [Betaproteobacteria bacterium]|nr:zinc-ribbon and DUF3426 domain-containing protein [Betaproteobacteria bacterium]
MLLTTCPNCNAQFKVLTDQLNVRQGRVMCGRCRSVFDAFQSLTRGPDTTGPHTPLHRPDLADSPPAATSAPQHGQASLEDDATAIVLEDLENDRAAPSAASLAGAAIDTGPGTGAPNALLAAAAGARAEPPHHRTTGWVVLSVLAGLATLLHAAYVFRSDLANHWPETRPWLARACETLACDLPYGRDESVMKIEASDLLELPGKGGRIQLTATVANRGRMAMDYPLLELRLTDNSNQTVLGKSLRPLDYLGAAPAANAHVPPGGEVFINLVAEVTPKVPASGYAVRAYYP